MTSVTPENVVVVAVRAEREISKTALAWALTHIVRPGDLVTLLAVLSDNAASGGGWRQRFLRGFARLGGDHGDRARRERFQISASCSQMALQIDGRNEVNVRIKVVGSEPSASSSSSGTAGSVGVVVAESMRVGANWVVLDKKLKQEKKHCMEELQCNIVVMKGSSAKVLRLNLGGILNKPLPPFYLSSSYPPPVCSEKFPDDNLQKQKPRNIREDPKKASVSHGETNIAGKPSSGKGFRRGNPYFIGEQNPLFERANLRPIHDIGSDEEGTSDSDGSRGASPQFPHLGLKPRQDETRRDYFSFHPFTAAAAQLRGVYLIPENHTTRESNYTTRVKDQNIKKINNNNSIRPPVENTKTLLEKFATESKYHQQYVAKEELGLRSNLKAEDLASYSSDVREAVSLFGSSPSVPPPLCSLCRHKAPVFGKPPRRFTYNELEMATDGFSDDRFVAEGGSGCVYRGILEDGQVVAVKQLKSGAGAGGAVQGEDEICEEVEMLSRAQHRNVVMLVGFCVEGQRMMLVYEYICNGSMDLHLNGGGKRPLEWRARVKIALGVARGLRYLHEDCRVGFVVHKDLRPNNILLTHDYDPLVGDFRLTRWQSEISLSVDTNIPEAFGYLAPEYIECGIVTDKSDVYAFGVVLLELITGRRAMDTSKPKGQQFLVDWARPLLSLASEEGQTIAVDRFLDPCLDRDQARFFSQELRAMARAASLCLRRDPQARPGMSKVLRILEGDRIIDPVLEFNSDSAGSRSGRIIRPVLHQDKGMVGSISYRFPQEAVTGALCAKGTWSNNNCNM